VDQASHLSNQQLCILTSQITFPSSNSIASITLCLLHHLEQLHQTKTLHNENTSQGEGMKEMVSLCSLFPQVAPTPGESTGRCFHCQPDRLSTTMGGGCVGDVGGS